MHSTSSLFTSVATTSTPSGPILERDFLLGDVPGVLWSPVPREGSSDPAVRPAPLVLAGHPGGFHKRAAGMVARAQHLVSRYGLHVASIDAPGHGDRPRSESDAAWVRRLGEARRGRQPLGPIVSEFNADLAARAVPEWRRTIDALQELPEIAEGPVGYSGMTVATEIGFRLAAAEPRVAVAGLGGAFASPGLLAAARALTIPVLYLLPWDDPEIPTEDGLAVFAAIGGDRAVLHGFRGGHKRVPAREGFDSARFLAGELLPDLAV